MNNVTLQNYRCFREKQSARLAPLTLLVGENSTGKTSFLALLRALEEVASLNKIPDFREDPYDLGAFEDTAYNRDSNSLSPDTFEAGFVLEQSDEINSTANYHVIFENRGGYPFPAIRKFSHDDNWVEVNQGDNADISVRFGELQNQHEFCTKNVGRYMGERLLYPFFFALIDASSNVEREVDIESSQDTVSKDNLHIKKRIIDAAENHYFRFMGLVYRPAGTPPKSVLFASAPIRSQPRRTYDPSRPTPDPQGEYIPSYLASMSRNAYREWKRLKSNLEDFGQYSGLFDEIEIVSFGETAGAPFQVQIRKLDANQNGPTRNLIDVGYGVSQALPILTELLREDSPKMFLLQQPEVHLHPRAQAALGSLFCNLAASGKQIIVETHSDYIIDRARMDIRDGKTGLKPDDISILYFERDELDVNIHSLRVDEEGNVLDAPPGYGQFFMDEMRRSVGL